jgi:hypothetical protein
MCDSYEARLVELLDALARREGRKPSVSESEAFKTQEYLQSERLPVQQSKLGKSRANIRLDHGGAKHHNPSFWQTEALCRPFGANI